MALFGNLSAVRLGLRLPSIFRRRRSFVLGFVLGASPARAPRSGAGGTPPPQRILRSCWAGEGIWACQKGQIGQKMVRFGQLVAVRSRQDELIERRAEEHKGMRLFAAMAIETSHLWWCGYPPPPPTPPPPPPSLGGFGQLGAARSRQAPRRAERGACSGIETAVFGVQCMRCMSFRCTP
jgi:hypothetical protein